MSAYQGVDLSSIPRQNLYATPRAPTAPSISRSPSRISNPNAANSPYRATISSANASASNAGRKRSRMPLSSSKLGHGSPLKPAQYRPSSRNTHHPRPSLPGRTSTFSPPPPADYLTPGHVSPPPLANSRYHLSDGFDTPTAAQADAYDRPVFSVGAENTRFFNRLRDDELDRPTYEHGLGAARDVAGPLAGGWRHGDMGNGSAKGGKQAGAQDGFSGLDEEGESLKRKRGSGPMEDTGHVGHGTGEDAQWSVRRALLNTVTGVAGMVFHFCTAGAFRGFAAGGGQAWTFGAGGEAGSGVPAAVSQAASSRANEASGLAMDDSWQDADFAQNKQTDQTQYPVTMTPRHQRRGSSSSPTYSYFSPQSSWPSPAARAAKKQKSSHADDGGNGTALRGNWILVDRDEDRSRASSPASNASPAGLRRKSGHGTRGGINDTSFRASIAGAGVPVTPNREPAERTRTPISTGAGRRRHFTATVSMPVTQVANGTATTSNTSSSRISYSGRASETKTPRTNLTKKLASNATLRASNSQPFLRPSPMNTTDSRAQDQQRDPDAARIRESYGFSSAPVPTNPASGAASPHKAGSVVVLETAQTESPLGKEGERLIRIRARREREEERELTRMNRRLEDMIRQGREALGTRFEVEEFEDEEMG